MLRRIHPDPAEMTPEEATTGLRLDHLAPPDRPYLGLNMVSTADGAATLAGRTRGLGDETDRAIFHGLRTQADCVMVGAGTARIERYGRLVREAEARGRRRAEGLAPGPLACVVSGALDLPADLPLLQDAGSRVVVITGAARDLPDVPATVEYLRPARAGEHRPPLRPLLRRLRSEHGVRSVLCEGGPTLNRSLLEEDLVDDLFLTISPKLFAGTPETTIVAGPPAPEPARLELITAYEAEASLFLRYRVAR